MAIVKMKKILVIGLNEKKRELVSALMKHGAVEIDPQDSRLADEEWAKLVRKDANETEAAAAEANAADAEKAVELLNEHSTAKKPLFHTRRRMTREAFETVMQQERHIAIAVSRLMYQNERLARLKTEENKVQTTVLSLKPWMSYQLPLDMAETRHVSINIGVVPAIADMNKVCAEAESFSETASVMQVSSDADLHYIVVMCMKEEREALLDVMHSHGFTPTFFKDLSGTAAENMQLAEEQLKKIDERRARAIKRIASMQDRREEIECYRDAMMMRRDRAMVVNRFLRTEECFYFEGYVPQDDAAVEQILNENGCYYEFAEIPPGEEAPVKLKNSKLVKPFEAITEMYSLPAYSGVDATPFLAVFYFIFFGMMLSDAVYGIVMSVACFVVLKKFHIEGMLKKLVTMFFYCGISTTFWGIMFGGWMGDIVQKAATTFFGVQLPEGFTLAVWFEPVNDPMKLLVFSCLLGVIHIFVGMGIKSYMLIKEGKWVDAICDEFTWIFIILGAGGIALGGVLSTIGTVLVAIGVLVILTMGGREKKGIGRVTGGLGSLYGVTSYLSDILSYSRLLALGLSTGVVASVVNTMGTLLGGGPLGAVFMLVVAVVGHSFNFLINSLGSFVHSSRLQYLEFFGKFYKDGGAAFEPFEQKTKYVEIMREEQ